MLHKEDPIQTEHELNEDLKVLLNKSKIQAILFKKSKETVHNFSLKIDESNIEFSNQVKDIGIVLQSDLKWSNNVANIS